MQMHKYIKFLHAVFAVFVIIVNMVYSIEERPRNISTVDEGHFKELFKTKIPFVNGHGVYRSKAVPFYSKYAHKRNWGEAVGSKPECPQNSDQATKRIIQLQNNTGVNGRTKYLLESFFGIVGAILFSITYIGYPMLDYIYSVFTIATNSTVNIQGLGREDSPEGGFYDGRAGRFFLVDNLAVPINDCVEWAICITANQATGRFESAIVDNILDILSGKNGILKTIWKTYRNSGTDRIYTVDAAVSCDQFVCQPFRFGVKMAIWLLDWNAVIKQTL